MEETIDLDQEKAGELVLVLLLPNSWLKHMGEKFGLKVKGSKKVPPLNSHYRIPNSQY